MSEDSVHWQRNLYVCVFGSFTTIMAMTLLLPFLLMFAGAAFNAWVFLRKNRAREIGT
ncbi:major facilitator transporter [Caballeronia catudaia]|uniref:Major facilitator transporter n=1 Tax=Caballeronia catudaia TaxID=1777136 RepID=A0A158CDG1_9BURK|nr:hypothetical protein [Caballeronia catudaia]SAK80339.1 major facilitator transporter [Caballeronia catudaia]